VDYRRIAANVVRIVVETSEMPLCVVDVIRPQRQ
jgi:hypothetical protein